MNLLTFFDKIIFQNILINFSIFYILIAILFGAHFVSCSKFDKPLLLNPFNLFSTFFLALLFWLFCFDFFIMDKLYFFNQCFQAIFVFFAISVLACSRDFFFNKNILKFEYDLLFLFVFISAIGLCFANEFLLIYLAIELQSLTLYVFATFNRNSEYSTEAGLKYFIFGGLMSCFLLLGICLIYLYFGSISFELINSIICFNYDPLFFLGILLLFCVLLFKVGCAPFHFWLCDIYDGSLLTVTFLFASIPKIILFGLFFKLYFFTFLDFNQYLSIFLGLSAIFSIIVGSISAIYQKRIKRLFAYSTIAHTGFILAPFFCSSLISAKALVFYVLIYSSLNIGLFSVLINISIANTIQPKYLINLSSIGYKNQLFAGTFSLIILSIAGIPPLSGFFSKFLILLTLIGAKFYFISFVIIFFSSIACFYYIRFIKIIFFVNGSKNTVWVTNNSKNNTEFFIGFFLFFIMFFFLYPNLLLNFSIAISLILF